MIRKWFQNSTFAEIYDFFSNSNDSNIKTIYFENLQLQNSNEFKQILEILKNKNQVEKFPRLEELNFDSNVCIDNSVVNAFIDFVSNHKYMFLEKISIVYNSIDSNGYRKIIDNFYSFKINVFHFGISSHNDSNNDALYYNLQQDIDNKMAEISNSIHTLLFNIVYKTKDHSSRHNNAFEIKNIINKDISETYFQKIGQKNNFKDYKQLMMLYLFNDILFSLNKRRNLDRIFNSFNLIFFKATDIPNKRHHLLEGLLNNYKRIRDINPLYHTLTDEVIHSYLKLMLKDSTGNSIPILRDYFLNIFVPIYRGQIINVTIEQENIKDKISSLYGHEIGDIYIILFPLIIVGMFEMLKAKGIQKPKNFNLKKTVIVIKDNLSKIKTEDLIRRLFYINTSQQSTINSTTTTSSSSQSKSFVKGKETKNLFDQRINRQKEEDQKAQSNNKKRKEFTKRVKQNTNKIRNKNSQSYYQIEQNEKSRLKLLRNIEQSLENILQIANQRKKSGPTYRNAIRNNLEENENKKTIQKNIEQISSFLKNLKNNSKPKQTDDIILRLFETIRKELSQVFINQTDKKRLLDLVNQYISLQDLSLSQLNSQKQMNRNQQLPKQKQRLKQQQTPKQQQQTPKQQQSSQQPKQKQTLKQQQQTPKQQQSSQQRKKIDPKLKQQIQSGIGRRILHQNRFIKATDQMYRRREKKKFDKEFDQLFKENNQNLQKQRQKATKEQKEEKQKEEMRKLHQAWIQKMYSTTSKKN